MEQTEYIEAQVRRWLEEVVIGLNLCPFAGGPYRDGRVRIVVTDAANEQTLLEDLQLELIRLDETPVAKLETTVMVLGNIFPEFEDYNQFLDLVDVLIEEFGWTGEFQVASFHPQYQFADTTPDAAENFTNRSPYPLLHLIREASLEKAVESYPDVGQIPERNIAKMRALSAEEKRRYFPYLV